MFHTTKANLGVCLRDFNGLDPDMKFMLIRELDLAMDSIDLDSISFNKILFYRLDSIKSCVLRETNSCNRVTYLIDGLIKHFNL